MDINPANAGQFPAHTPLPVHQLTYDGKLRHIAKLWLVNLALFFMTLSLYRFWGRTRVRQYVWSHIRILGDRLEYTGTGKELFLGFSMIIPVLLILIAAQQFLGDVIGGGLTFLYLALGILAVYSGLRYRVTRTSWRAIHGYMPSANYNGYLGVSLKRNLLDLVSLSFTKPRSDLLKWKYLVEHVHLGTIHAKFEINTKGLKRKHFLSLILGMALFAFISYVIFKIFNATLEQSPGENLSKDVRNGLVLFAILFAMPVYFIARQWYIAALMQKKFSGISIGNITFKTHFGIWRYIGFRFVNLLIMLFTLGLGSAFILHRKARFFCRFITMEGTMDETIMAQMRSDAERANEGMLDVFGFDLAFMS